MTEDEYVLITDFRKVELAFDCLDNVQGEEIDRAELRLVKLYISNWIDVYRQKIKLERKP